MNIIWTAIEAVEATQGQTVDKWSVSGVQIDSRMITKGDLFIALKGDNHDGHDYIDQAFNNGAVAAVVDQNKENISKDYSLLLVDDTIKALNNLAEYNRNRSKAHFIAVTGSVGKTSSKEIIRIALSNFNKAYASYGNYNNHLGVPLSLARLPLDSKFAIMELGMNHPGEITPLSRAVRPHIAIITNVEAVHLEFFGSVEKIADAKAEIFTGLDKGGYVILNKDNTYFHYLQNKAKQYELNVISFGEADDADIRLLKYTEDEKKSYIEAKIMDKVLTYEMGCQGIHLAKNTLAMLAVCHILKLDIEIAAKSMLEFKGEEGRGRRHNLNINGKNILLIDDSYNASPISVKAAINSLGRINTPGRKLLILADMRELGSKAQAFHEDLKHDIINNNIDKVIAVGELMKHLYNMLPEEKRLLYCNNFEEIIDKIENYIVDNDKILIKGSFGTKIFKLTEYLVK